MKKEKSKEKKKGRLKAFIKKHKVLSIIIALVLVIAIVAGGFGLKNKNSDSQSYSFIRTTTLAKGTLEDTISAKGTIQSANTSNVTTSLNYTIKSINVSVGDTVSKGDVICTLDTSELESQIEKEEKNLAKTKSSAQSSYNSAKKSYNSAKTTYNNYLSTYNDAKSAYNTAKSAYNKAVSSLKSYHSAYDSALLAFNNAGAKYVKTLNEYNSAVRAYKSNNSSSNKRKLISAAKAYMKAAQNYYGKCANGKYDISDSTESSSNSSDKMSQDNSAVSASSSQSITVTQTADEICSAVISNVKTLTGTILTKTSGTNTLYKLASKAKTLQNAKQICNYSSLESAYTTAKNTYNESKQTKSQYSDAVSQAKEQLERAAEELENASTSDTLDELKSQLSECSLKTEQDGTVTALNATVGSSAGMDSAVATIQDLKNLEVSITIEEADINNVETGLTCRVTTDAEDDALSAELTQINPVSSDGSFGATVTINDITDEIYIGMNASVDIIVSSSANVYQVPIDAVGTDGDTKYVYLKTGGSGTDMTFEKVTVNTGSSNDYYIEITSAELSEGDVIRSNSDLSEGIETVSDSEKNNENSGGLFSSLFGGSRGGGDMPQGGGDMPSPPSSSGSSSSSSKGSSDMPSPPSGGFPGGSNG